MTNAPNFKQPLIVWWVIWAALLTGIFVIYFVVGSAGGGAQSGSASAPHVWMAVGSPGGGAQRGSASADFPVWMVGFVPFVISTVVRWLVLPRVQGFQTAFSLFIVGLAMGEAPCILGVFAIPAHKAELFALSVLGILQFAPYFAGRFESREG